MNILDMLENTFKEKYPTLKILSVVFFEETQKTEIVFLYPFDTKLDSCVADEIKEFIKKQLDFDTEIEVKFKKSYLDRVLIEDCLLSYLKINYVGLFSSFDKNNLEILSNDKNVEIMLKLEKTIFEYAEKNRLKNVLFEVLNKKFIANFKIDFKCKENSSQTDILKEREESFLQKLPKKEVVQRYEVKEPTVLIGNEITPYPEFLINQKAERKAVIFAGKISSLIQKEFLSRRAKAAGSEEKSLLINFVLTDPTASFSCVYFSNKTTRKKIEKIAEGSEVLIIGDIAKGYKALEITVRHISYCTIDFEAAKQKFELLNTKDKQTEINQDYKVVKPEKHIELSQDNLFSVSPKYNDYIMQNTFVVFDCETTGFNCIDNEIIEIGACKMKNGKIIEKFSSLVQPRGYISDRITQITGISNFMTSNSPFIEDVIKDFHKFCDGAILVGYNVGFDVGFIQEAAKKCNFGFKNEVFDVLALAKNSLYLPKYKLINVAEHFSIDLKDAHRAFADALATAKVLLKLSIK